jgi:glycosyltransferase involved in cell wall biosynthesis
MGLCRKILVIEPYFGGSHRLFLQELEEQLDLRFTLLTLPARKWKWRMRFAAPWVAAQLGARRPDVEAVLCSTFVDVATLRGLAPAWFNSLPILTYFHENQFAYPVRNDDERDFHFGLTNYTTALASDRLGFNSRYNLDTFLAGCQLMEKKAPDVRLAGAAAIAAKATVLPVGLDFTALDRLAAPGPRAVPVIVWNHRWEHDKNPELFFQTLFELAADQVAFQLIVMGQCFERQPAIFAEARERLADRLIHFGYVADRHEYLRLLKQGTIIVSTADHEFYGISVLEAVRAGCRPLLPRRLSYPELFGDDFLYADARCFKMRLADLLATTAAPLDPVKSRQLTDPFSWPMLRQSYEQWLTF